MCFSAEASSVGTWSATRMLGIGIVGNCVARPTASSLRSSSVGTGMFAGLLARYFKIASWFQTSLRAAHIAGRLSRLAERRVGLRARTRLPRERVVLPAIARPRIEHVDDVIELGRELGHRPEQ